MLLPGREEGFRNWSQRSWRWFLLRRNQRHRVRYQGEASVWRTSAVVWPGEQWAPLGRYVQDTLRMNEYLFRFQFRNVEGACKIFICTAIFRSWWCWWWWRGKEHVSNINKQWKKEMILKKKIKWNSACSFLSLNQNMYMLILVITDTKSFQGTKCWM